ncbi:MAG: histidine kinase [Hungatella sp.]|nr:histidine kinase [Hungatella sp.]
MLHLLQKKIAVSSIKGRLSLIVAVQIILALLFWLFTVTLSTYQTYNDTSNRYDQTGEQFLSKAEAAVSYVESVTLFPSQLHTQNNDTYISKTLRDGNILNNVRFYNYFNAQAQNRFVNDSLDFISIYDLDGNGLAAFCDAPYQLCFIQNSPDWYLDMLPYNTGISMLISADSFYGSGLHDRDLHSVCTVRGVIDPNTFSIVGYCVAGISTGWLEQTFHNIKLAPNQTFELYKDGTRLFGTARLPRIFEETASTGQTGNFSKRSIRMEDGKLFAFNLIVHSGGYGLLIQTPLSDMIGSVGGIWTGFSICIGIFLLILVYLICHIVKTVLRALRDLIEACNHLEAEHATAISPENLPLEIQTLFSSFNRMSSRISSLVQEVFLKQQKQQETELQLLRTQINPHYLYNTLEIMHMKAYSHRDYEVAAMSELLGQNLQYGLRNTTKETTLEEELSQMKIYLSLLSYQYRDRIKTTVSIETDLLPCRVIKLIFQPIIENAVIHGMTSADQVLSIDIFGYRDGEHMILKITDDGCGMTPQQLEELNQNIENPAAGSIGLRNVCRRIQLNYGPEYKVKIDSTSGIGTAITLTVPWRPVGQEA